MTTYANRDSDLAFDEIWGLLGHIIGNYDRAGQIIGELTSAAVSDPMGYKDTVHRTSQVNVVYHYSSDSFDIEWNWAKN